MSSIPTARAANMQRTFVVSAVHMSPKTSAIPMEIPRHNEIVVMGLEMLHDLEARLGDELLELAFDEEVVEPPDRPPFLRPHGDHDVPEPLLLQLVPLAD